MSDDGLTNLLTRAVDRAVEGVVIPPAPVVPLRRRSPRLAPLASAAAVAAVVGVVVLFDGQQVAEDSLGPAATGPSSEPPLPYGGPFDPEQEDHCPAAFANAWNATDGQYVQQQITVAAGEQVEIPWSGRDASTEVTLTDTDTGDVLARRADQPAHEVTSLSFVADRSRTVELGGVTNSGYRCHGVVQYEITVR